MLFGLLGGTAWLVIGLASSLLFTPRVSIVLGWLAFVYAGVYGVCESLTIRSLPVPSSTWQLPANSLRGRTEWGKAVIWAVVLGPGLMTRNPFPAMGLLVLLPFALPGYGFDAFQCCLISGAIGLAHGAFRGVSTSANPVTSKDSRHVLETKALEFGWRRLQGNMMVVGTGPLYVLAIGGAMLSR